LHLVLVELEWSRAHPDHDFHEERHEHKH
jgi:hypothetical protein